MKLVIEIPEEAKRAFDCAESNDLKGSYYDFGGVIGKAIANGKPLDAKLDEIRTEIESCLKALDKIEKSGFNIYLPNEMSGRRLTYKQCLGFIDKYKVERDTEKRKECPHKPCINYEDGCEEWAGCPCVHYKTESEESE